MKYHNVKGNNCIDNISQEHPVDNTLKLKLYVPAALQKKAVSLVTEIIQG